MKRYSEEYRRSLEAPEDFWREQAQAIDWFEFPPTILDQDDNGAWRWFRGGKLNTAWLALDRHVEAGRGAATALIYDSPATGQIRRFTFAELTERVARVAGGLARLGVGKGDRVIVYMPMVPEAVIAMLACARLGAVHSVVFGGFAAPELAVRIDDAEPRLVLSASCGIEFDRVIPYKPLLDEALALAEHQPDYCVILQRPQATAELADGRDLDWSAWEAASAPTDPVPVDATDPLYILYTSGTTGKPKGVLRDHGGHAVALHYTMHAVYGVDVGDVFWAASDVGWVVGHSYIAYAPLLKGATSILYEGKPVRTPDAGAFWRVIAEHRVKSFFVAPTAFRAIKKEDPEARLKACLRHELPGISVRGRGTPRPPHLPLAKGHPARHPGHRPLVADRDRLGHLREHGGLRPARNPRRQPELPRTGLRPAHPRRRRSRTRSRRGGATSWWSNPSRRAVSPPSGGDHERFLDAYFRQYPGYYLTGDGGYRDADGYVYIMGRVDDVMNVAGHRLSTGELEEVVADHPAVAECAVVGIRDEEKGQVPLGLLLLKDGVNLDGATLERELVQMVRQGVGPFANFRRALVVPQLPKTRSGKILRQVLRKMIDGDPYVTPSTIDDPAILAEIEEVLVGAGVMQGN